MTLRAQIETAIRTSPDSSTAALAVCRLLDDELGLMGNGWFDDDAELLALLSAEPEVPSADHWTALALRIESALSERLRAAHREVCTANLLQEISACTQRDLAALLDDHEIPSAELDVLRRLVEARIKLSSR